MRAGRDPLVSHALPGLSIDRDRACSVAVTRNRRFCLRLAAWLIGLPLILFVALFPAWNRAVPSHRHEFHGGIAGSLKVAATNADDYDLLDDARREEASGFANSPHVVQVHSRTPSEDADLLDDAQREDARGAPNRARI